MSSATDQYLERYAEPESRLAAEFRSDRRYARVLVVPACRERVALLDGYTAAAAAAPGPVLCVLVVNAPADAADGVHASNAELLAELRARLVPLGAWGGEQVWLGRDADFDVLVVDRASSGRLLPAKQGVGMARRIGCDLALALWRRGHVTCQQLFCTDADVSLPSSYFDVPAHEAAAAARVQPFWHERSSDVAVDRATAVYEIALRYYVLGLRWAGSPYAFHTIGSCVTLGATAYAAVRGFPRRAAAEDFYVLNKLAKVGAIVSCGGEALQIRSRTSDRVPFGTGRGVAQILESGEPSFYDPRVFEGLRRWLAALRGLVAHRTSARVLDELGQPADALAHCLVELAGAETLPSVLDEAIEQACDPVQLERRLVIWFDAFRTLKLVHALRDRLLPSVPRAEALRSSPFLSGLDVESGQDDDLDRLDAARRGLVRLEARDGIRSGSGLR